MYDLWYCVVVTMTLNHMLQRQWVVTETTEALVNVAYDRDIMVSSTTHVQHV